MEIEALRLWSDFAHCRKLEADDDFPRILVSCLALEGFSVTSHFFF